MLVLLLVIRSGTARHNKSSNITITSLPSFTLCRSEHLHSLFIATSKSIFRKSLSFNSQKKLSQILKQASNPHNLPKIATHDCSNKTANRNHSKMCMFGRQLYSCGLHAITGTYDRIPYSCDANKAARKAKYGFCPEVPGTNQRDITTTTSCPTCHPGDEFFDYDKYAREHGNNSGGAPRGSAGSSGRAHASSSRQAAPGSSSSSMRQSAPVGRQAAPVGRTPALHGGGRTTHSSTSSGRTSRPAGKRR